MTAGPITLDTPTGMMLALGSTARGSDVKPVQVTEKHRLNASYMKCRHCGKRVKAGDVVLHQRLPEEQLDIIFHVRCVKRLAEAAPPDANEIAFRDLTDQIRTTGKVFS